MPCAAGYAPAWHNEYSTAYAQCSIIKFSRVQRSQPSPQPQGRQPLMAALRYGSCQCLNLQAVTHRTQLLSVLASRSACTFGQRCSPALKKAHAMGSCRRTCRSSVSSSATRARRDCTTPTSANRPAAGASAPAAPVALPAASAAALAAAVGLLGGPSAAAAAACVSCANASFIAMSLDADAADCSACSRSRSWSRCVSAVSSPDRSSFISSWLDSCSSNTRVTKFSAHNQCMQCTAETDCLVASRMLL